MPIPYTVARFNKRVTNRYVEPLARRSNGFAVVHHVGRTSGARYATPVNLFDLGDEAIVVLTYGPIADWARNVMAAGGTVENASGVRRIDTAEVVDRTIAWPALPRFVRGALRVMRVNDFMKLTLSNVEGSSASG